MNGHLGAMTIHEAELRVMQSSRNVRESLSRVRTAFRTSAARPSTLLKVAGVTGLLCFWLARRTGPQPGNSVAGFRARAVTSALGLLSAFIIRFGVKRLAVILR
jgi:hypothetical protein